jgi:ribonuclease HI
MSLFKSRAVIYTDGACSGNPGPGGYGSIVITENQVVELAGAEPDTTNNRMEMLATIKAFILCLQFSKKNPLTEILIFTDSVYVIRGITEWIHGWKRRGWKTATQGEVSNQDLWQKLDDLINEIKKQNSQVKFNWNFVKGHSGDPGNERCDEMAVACSKNDYIELYLGSHENYRFDVSVMPEIKDLPDMKKKSDSATKTAWYISFVNGVFTRHETWKQCEALVKGRAAKFKKVSSEAEETQIKKSWGLN